MTQPTKLKNRLTQVCGSQNKFTDAEQFDGDFYFVVTGAFNATVTLQASFDGKITWVDIETTAKTSPFFRLIKNISRGTFWRAGIKTGDYNSGTANVELVN